MSISAIPHIQPLVDSDCSASVVFDYEKTGLKMPSIGHKQFTVAGDLDGGTWGIDGLFLDDTWRPLASGKDATQFVHLGDEYICKAYRVTFAGAGAGAAVTVSFAALGRQQRFGIA